MRSTRLLRFGQYCTHVCERTAGKAQMKVRRLTAAIAAYFVGFSVVVLGGCSSSKGATTTAHQVEAAATTTVQPVEQHGFTGTTRSKTFEIDESAYTTGRGNVSAVGLVALRIGDEPMRHGARTGFGKFAGSPLRWTLEDTIYFDEGSVRSSGLCVTTADPGGSFTARCKLTIDGGSGSFEGATGTNNYTCRVASADVNAIATCDAKGVIAY
jgi:hypothetical protein